MSLRLASALCLLVAACSSDPNRPPPGTTPTTTQPGSGNSPGGGGGTTPDGGTVVDSGSDAGAVCNDLALGGALVDQTAVSGDPPTGTGGSIVDGTYDLTDATLYVGAGTIGPTGSSFKETIRIAGGVMDQYRTTQTASGTTTIRASYTLALNAATATLAETCPTASLAQQWTFTVTGSQLALISPTSRVEFVYTKK